MKERESQRERRRRKFYPRRGVECQGGGCSRRTAPPPAAAQGSHPQVSDMPKLPARAGLRLGPKEVPESQGMTVSTGL